MVVDLREMQENQWFSEIRIDKFGFDDLPFYIVGRDSRLRRWQFLRGIAASEYLDSPPDCRRFALLIPPSERKVLRVIARPVLKLVVAICPLQVLQVPFSLQNARNAGLLPQNDRYET